MFKRTCQVKACVHDSPERHTLLPLRHPFFIPGQRFRELYYWDSYWVVRGLLVSNMAGSAQVLPPALKASGDDTHLDSTLNLKSKQGFQDWVWRLGRQLCRTLLIC